MKTAGRQNQSKDKGMTLNYQTYLSLWEQVMKRPILVAIFLIISTHYNSHSVFSDHNAQNSYNNLAVALMSCADVHTNHLNSKIPDTVPSLFLQSIFTLSHELLLFIDIKTTIISIAD